MLDRSGAEVAASELLKRLLNALVAGGTDVVVARNYEGYPESITGDVDLIVPPEQHSEAIRCLINEASGAGWRPFLVIRRPYLSYVGLVADHTGLDRGVLVVELFAGGTWAGLEFISAEVVSAAAAPGPHGWKVPRPAHEALLSSLHHLLWNRRIPEKYGARIRELISSDPSEFRRVCRAAVGRRLANVLARAATKERLGEVGRWATRARRQLALRCVLRGRAPVAEVLRAVLHRRAVGSAIVVGLVERGEETLVDDLMELTEKWHIGSPAARVLLRLPEDRDHVQSELDRIRYRGGLLLAVARDVAELDPVDPSAVAIIDGRGCSLLGHTIPTPAPTELWRMLLRASIEGGVR